MSRTLTALAVGLLLVACSAATDVPGSTSAADSTVPGDATTTVPSNPNNGPEEEADPDDPLVQAVGAFQSWVDHLAAGDHQEAWDAMAPASQAAVGEQQFFESVVFEISEGWGSWSAAEDVLYRLEVDEAGRTLLWVSGTISPEGMTEDREVSVPMVETDTGFLVSPFEEFGNVADSAP